MENSQKTKRPLALITGASAGIGKIFASHLAKKGCDLILVARRADKLREIAAEITADTGCGVEIIQADLSDDAQRRGVTDRIRSAGGLEYLVNNAGFGTLQNFWEADLKSQDTMARLHVLAVVDLTHTALADMIANGRGNIINTASVAGFFQSRTNVMYCSTKAWLISFTQGLSFELIGTGVKAMALCPGYTYSEFHDVMDVDRNAIPKSWWMSGETVVSDGLRDMEKGKVVSVPGLWRYKIMCKLAPLMPLWLVKRFSEHRHSSAEKRGRKIQM